VRACAHQLDAIELEQHADVVGDAGQGRVEQARDLGRAGLAVDAQSLEDALPQRMRQRLGEIGIDRPIPSGIRAGGRHSPIEQCPAEPGPGRPARIDASSIRRLTLTAIQRLDRPSLEAAHASRGRRLAEILVARSREKRGVLLRGALEAAWPDEHV
jgi:hypothetical protein